MFARWKPFQVVFTLWVLLALALLLPVTLLLRAAFPILTGVWILVPLVVVWRTNDPGRVGFRAISWRQLIQTTAINLAALLAIMALFEPWSP